MSDCQTPLHLLEEMEQDPGYKVSTQGQAVPLGQGMLCHSFSERGQGPQERMCRGLIEPYASSDSKESACNAGDPSSIPGSGRSPGEGDGNPLQYSLLENPMDRGDWQATVHGVAKSQTQLSDFHFLLCELQGHTHADR